MLKLMTEKGLLVSEGYGKGTRYVLPINGIDILIEEPSNVATLSLQMLQPQRMQMLRPRSRMLQPQLRKNVSGGIARTHTAELPRMDSIH